MSDFGKKFKSAREAKGITLEAIAQETRISTRFLRAIEEESFELLPGGVFNRGFIRTYASRVGLDPDSAIAEYKGITTETEIPELLEPVKTHPVESSDRHVLPVAVAGLVILIVLFYVFGYDGSSGPTAATRNTTPVLASEPAAPAPVPSPPSAEFMESAMETSSAAPIADIAETDARRPGVNVQLEVHDETWVAVQSDGQEVVGGVIFRPGTNRSYTAEQALELTIGNAAGLTLSINGREVQNLGRAGQVRVLTITPDNAELLTGS